MLFGHVYCIVDYCVYFACDTIIVDVCLSVTTVVTNTRYTDDYSM